MRLSHVFDGTIDEAWLKANPPQVNLRVQRLMSRADGHRLSDFEGLKSAVNRSQGREMQLTLMRGEKEINVPVTAEQEPAHPQAPGAGEHCPAFNSYWNDLLRYRVQFARDPAGGVIVEDTASEDNDENEDDE